jgi:hypothetical protein
VLVAMKPNNKNNNGPDTRTNSTAAVARWHSPNPRHWRLPPERVAAPEGITRFVPDREQSRIADNTASSIECLKI